MRVKRWPSRPVFNRRSRKCAINLTLSDELVSEARELTDNLSGVVESLLENFVKHERRRLMAKTKTVDATIRTWNDFNAEYGSFADDHSTL